MLNSTDNIKEPPAESHKYLNAQSHPEGEQAMERQLIAPKHKYQIELPKNTKEEQKKAEINGQQIDIDIEKYLQMNILNPDWDFATRHGQASKPGLIDQNEEKQQCIHCLKQINKNPIPLCDNSKQLQFLGQGFPLYFIFIKYTIIILLLQILNYSAMNLFFAVEQNYDFCYNSVPKVINGVQFKTCHSFMILIANINSYVTTQQLFLRWTSYLTLLVSLIYVRDTFTKTWKYYKERTTTYATFSVLMEHFPSKNQLKEEQAVVTMGERIRRFFGDRSIFPDEPVICNINLVGELDNILKWEKEKKQKLHQLADIRKKIKNLRINIKDSSEKQIQQIQLKVEKLKQKRKQQKDKIKNLMQQIHHEKQKLKRLIMNQDLNTYKAIVSFEYEQDKKNVLKTVVSQSDYARHFTQKGKNISIVQSPQPDQINWETISLQQAGKKRNRFLSWIFFILMLTALTVCIYFLFQNLVHQISVSVDATGTFIIYCYLVGIIIFNKFILSHIIHLFVDFQQHKTGENYQFSFMLKYSLGLFFTTAVMTLLVQGAFHVNVFESKYGIIEEQTIMFFFSAFLVPLIWLINPWYLWKLLKRKCYKNTPFITQEQANKLMQNPEYIMGKRYGQILQSLWFTFLYVSLIPLGTVFICCELCMFYWIDKYNLLRKSSITQNVSANLCTSALFLMEFILILKPAGEMIFDDLVRGTWHVGPIVELGVGLLYIILPIGSILNFFHPQKFNESDIIYDELKEKNFFSYELYNPLTKEQDLKKHFENIEQSQNRQIVLVDPEPKEEQGRRRMQRKKTFSFARPHEAGKLRKSNKRLNHRQNAGTTTIAASQAYPTESQY